MPSMVARTLPTADEQSAVVPRFLALASIAGAADLVTKGIATAFLANDKVVPLAERFFLTLVYNTGSAGGISIGPFTGSLNVLVTVIAIIMVARIVAPLAAVDARATLPLALVSGGAFGNLASMLVGPQGVADFFAVQLTSTTTIVMNLADLLLWSGALLLGPVIATLVRAMRAERRLAA